MKPFRQSFVPVRSAVLCAAVMCTTARATQVPCADLEIDASTIPNGSYLAISTTAGVGVVFPAFGNPVIDIRIAPPVTLNPADPYICDVDYMADLTAGTATLTFQRNAPYFVQITRNDGNVESLMVQVGVRRHGGAEGCVEGPAKEIDCGTPKVVLVSSTLGFDHSWGAAGVVVDSIAAARAAVAAAYKANDNTPIDVSIDAHGSPGNIELGDDRLDADTADDFMSSIEGMVNTLTIFACSVADGAEGEELICILETGLDADTTGYTGENWDNPPDEEQTWWTAGEPYSWEPCDPDEANVAVDGAISSVATAASSMTAAGPPANATRSHIAASIGFNGQATTAFDQVGQLANQCGTCAKPVHQELADVFNNLLAALSQELAADAYVAEVIEQLDQAIVQLEDVDSLLDQVKAQLNQNPPDFARIEVKLIETEQALARVHQKLDRAIGKLQQAIELLQRAIEKYQRAQERVPIIAALLNNCGPCGQPALQALQEASQFNSAAMNAAISASQNAFPAMQSVVSATSAVQSAESLVHQALLLTATCPQGCPGDANGDNLVNVIDLLAVINGWGGGGPSDVNGDGTTDVLDLLMVINGWGSCDLVANDSCANALPITLGVTPYSTVGATTDGVPSAPNQCNDFGQNDTHNDIWYSFAASQTGTLLVTTCAQLGGSSDYDSDLVMYANGAPGGANCPPEDSARIACNDDDPNNPCGTGAPFSSTMLAQVVAGAQYRIRVGGWSASDSGNGNLNLNILINPCGNGTVEPGEQCDDGNGQCGDGCCNCVCEYIEPVNCDAEGEPCLNDGNTIDAFNGGCNSTPTVYGTITVNGNAICGAGSTYVFNGTSNRRDTDWYRFVVAATANHHVELRSSSPGWLTGIVSGVQAVGSPCVGAAFVAGSTASTTNNCNVVGASVSLTPAAYAVFSGPGAFTGFPCSSGPHAYVVSLKSP